ncbi:MAG: alpha-methylacyl-CoA racemase [Gammaproteobacteria bacterium]|nr:alpha-methylacyl-CoA racemase [Gammaproteobacteria bacterium]
MGPLKGVKVVEFAGIGPASFAGMLLADLGAGVVRIERLSGTAMPISVEPRRDLMSRGRKSVALNLRSPQAIEVASRIVRGSDLLIEGFRPGVMERLGLGPERCLELNPRLIFGRVTGWGQTGPMRDRAGHDINFIALSGALDLIGRAGEPPCPPLNLVGDMGGGGLLLAFGLVCALLEARQSGMGQVVDSAMVDGSALQLSAILMAQANGHWDGPRGTHFSDTGSHFYEVYATADEKYVAVGAIEPAFYAQLCQITGIDVGDPPDQMNPVTWPGAKKKLADIFRQRTREEWALLAEKSDCCITPVLSPTEAHEHPHLRERGTYMLDDGILQPAPAPRFSRTPGQAGTPPSPGQHTRAILREHGYDNEAVDALISQGVVGADDG